jgi:hypothetical protein
MFRRARLPVVPVSQQPGRSRLANDSHKWVREQNELQRTCSSFMTATLGTRGAYITRSVNRRHSRKSQTKRAQKRHS